VGTTGGPSPERDEWEAYHVMVGVDGGRPQGSEEASPAYWAERRAWSREGQEEPTEFTFQGLHDPKAQRGRRRLRIPLSAHRGNAGSGEV
jgi:hypothetical protein